MSKLGLTINEAKTSLKDARKERAPCAGTGRSHAWPRRPAASGPHREGEEP